MGASFLNVEMSFVKELYLLTSKTLLADETTENFKEHHTTH